MPLGPLTSGAEQRLAAKTAPDCFLDIAATPDQIAGKPSATLGQ